MDERAATTPTSLDGALARARTYLEIHGDQTDLARLAGAGKAEAPFPQNPDGGWPGPWSAGTSTVLGTCQVLDLLAGLDAPGADRAGALSFLIGAQTEDGTWTEAPEPTEPTAPPPAADWFGGAPPEWLRPGSAAARTYLTAYCARVLLVGESEAAGRPEVADAVERAAHALEWSLDPHGRLPGPLPAHWFAARVFRATGRQLQARRLLDVVGRVFDHLDVSDLASFGADVEPGDRWAKRIAARLLALQAEDGSWSAEGVATAALTASVAHVLSPVVEGA